MENLREQIKDMEINNLRCLNSCLSYTIDVLSQRQGPTGLSHSPYFGVPCPPFVGPNMFPGIESSWPGGGISHSPFAVPQTPYAVPQTPYAVPQTPYAVPQTPYPYYVDWFGGMPRTGLSHTPAPMYGWQPWQQWPTYPIDPLRQQQLARFEAFCRGMYG